jgi:CrcB protein
MKLLWLMGGGALGTLLRYLVSGWAMQWGPGVFPYGTMAVNVLGSFFIGVFWAVFESGNLQVNHRLFLFTGLFGGFTTFSSYSLETLNLVRDQEIKLAVLNFLGNNLLGFIGVVAGFMLVKLLIVR